MRAYLDILRNILENGKEKFPERKSEGGRKLDNWTIGLPNQVFSHDMSNGFPLLTTKKMGLKNIAIELEGFIKGITSKQWYKQRGCNIWNEWANPEAVKEFYNQNYVEPYNQQLAQDKFDGVLNIEGEYLAPFGSVKKHIQLSIDDLGPVYGRQWRAYDEQYGPMNCHESEWKYGANGVFKGTDQLQNILDTLKQYPQDRRMICIAWNPNQLDMQALPACHYSWGITVYDNKIHLLATLRSWDYLLGGPYNIASYALLQCLLCKYANLEVGNLTIVGLDTHLYSNQFEAVRQQLEREPLTLPQLEIPDNDVNGFDFWKWDHTQFTLKNYSSYDALSKVSVTI